MNLFRSSAHRLARSYLGSSQLVSRQALSQMCWWESRRSGRPINEQGPIPWMTYSAIDFLDQTLPLSISVLEIGAGGSTLWWAARRASVTSLETSTSWATEVQATLEFEGLSDNCQIIPISCFSEAQATLQGLPANSFDVVINDGLEPRAGFAAPLANLLTPTGFFVWDNSERTEYHCGLAELQDLDFWRLDFFGLGPVNSYAWQTTVLGRAAFAPQGRSLEQRPVALTDIQIAMRALRP